MVEDYNRQIMALDAQIKNGGKKPGAGSGESQDVRYLQQKMDALKIMRDQLVAGAKEINKPIKIESNIPDVTGGGRKGGGGRGGGGKKTTDPTFAADSIAAQQQLVSDLTKKWNEAGEDMRTGYLFQLVEAEKKLKTMKDEQQALKDMKTMKNTLPEGLADQLFPRKSLNELLNVKFDRKQSGHKDDKNNDKTVVGEMQKLTGGVQGIFSGIEQMGVEIPEELQGIMSGIQGVMTILTSITSILGVIEALQTPQILPIFARGGIVPHAAGGYEVPGTHFSGDVTPILANAGEVVLNRAQTAGLAHELEGIGGGNGGTVQAILSGEQAYIMINRYTKRSGKGELMTWK
jgi:hypothetical protein